MSGLETSLFFIFIGPDSPVTDPAPVVTHGKGTEDETSPLRKGLGRTHGPGPDPRALRFNTVRFDEGSPRVSNHPSCINRSRRGTPPPGFPDRHLVTFSLGEWVDPLVFHSKVFLLCDLFCQQFVSPPPERSVTLVVNVSVSPHCSYRVTLFTFMDPCRPPTPQISLSYLPTRSFRPSDPDTPATPRFPPIFRPPVLERKSSRYRN